MKPIELDVECYVDYFLVKFRNYATGGVREFEMFPGHPLHAHGVLETLRCGRVYTFNGINYDMPMITLAISLVARKFEPEEACRLLKQASDWIIIGNNRGWQFYQQFQLDPIKNIDHVDLIEVAFGQGSLKLYGGRLHSRKLQDLPIEPSASIAETDRISLRAYCGNDLETTGDLRVHLAPQIELRELMSASYGVDLRSKSDAQIAEAVIKSEVSKILGEKVFAPDIPPGTSFRYRAPAFVSFLNIRLQHLLRDIEAASFVIGANGQPIEPPVLQGRNVRIGKSVYRMGIGGLHSSETNVAHYADDDTLLIDRDVASYYPAIVLNCRIYPKHLTSAFLAVYKSIFDRRITAKRTGHKTTADTLKIVLNGSFGKFGSMYSALYSPDLMIQVTVTGQLCLLMLIEWLEHVGIAVVSANTDGIVIKCPKSKKALLDSTVAIWEARTGFETEETRYRALFSRDVNNYIALKEKGGTKGKGAFAETSIAKNPQSNICVEAVKAYLEHGTPLSQTIRECTDVRKFVTVRTVRGGAVQVLTTNYDDSLTPARKKDLLLSEGWQITESGPVSKVRLTRPGTRDTLGEHGVDVETAYRARCGPDEVEYIGKVIRYYYAAGEERDLRYKIPTDKGTNNRVPNSVGARPLMELPDTLPDDIDYALYERLARDILKDVGYVG